MDFSVMRHIRSGDFIRRRDGQTLSGFTKTFIKLVAEQLKNKIPSNKPLEMCLQIFNNNLMVGLVLIISAWLFLPVAAVILAVNGFIIGNLGAFLVYRGGLHAVYLFLAGILPHGFLEIPSVILEGAVGMKLGSCMYARMIHPALKLKFQEARRDLELLIPLFIILIALAAIIEAFVTPALIRLLAFGFEL
ncbi:MAG: stage II sporulation protein M [Bacillota bacterium]